MFATSQLSLSAQAFENNLKFLRSIHHSNVIISFVIKGNAYGHGIEYMVDMAEKHDVTHFSVYSADEALKTLDACKSDPTVLIMGHIDDDHLDWAIANDVEFFVFELDRVKAAKEAAERVQQKAKIHIEIETGMNRTGFDETQYEELIKYLNKNAQHFGIEGICTHYAGAESITNYVRVENQKKRFNAAIDTFKSKGIDPRQIHSCCSAASIRLPEMHGDLVRVGIMHYGFWPSKEIYIEQLRAHDEPKLLLQRVLSWHSKVMSVKSVKTGEFIGYGTTFLASEDKKIATVPIGYSHGFARSLSNTGRVLINGKRVSVLGIVNMNALVIDISRAPDTKKGDEVVLIGKQAGLELSVASFGELSEQLNYELLTRLPLDIPRKIVD